MQTQPIQSIGTITATLPQTSFTFRQLINVRPWHAIALADEAARTPCESRPAGSRAARLRRLGFLALLAAVCFTCSALRAGQSVSVSWNASTNAGVAGYIFYRGTNTGVYTSQFDLGTNTTITLTGLKEGQMNYFTVAEYNLARTMGPTSPEINYLVPGLVKLARPSGPGTKATMTFSAASGHSYDVQASSGMVTWTTIWSSGTLNSNGWVTFQDPQSATLSQRFYRLVMH